MNASAALVVGKVAKDFKEGVEIARSALKDGKAGKKLLQLIEECGDTEKLKEVERKFINATSGFLVIFTACHSLFYMISDSTDRWYYN